MSEFQLFFRAGINHVADLHNCHHLLFLISLYIIYTVKQWKYILILLTAFTLGHCLSLLQLFIDSNSIPPEIISFFIPALVFVAALLNLPQKSDKFRPGIYKIKYITALIFGFIHSSGFYHDISHVGIKDTKPFFPLISFNLGVECFQIIITLAIVASGLLVVDIVKVARRDWIMIMSGIAMGASIILMILSFPW